MKMTIKAIMTDVDGTLLTSKQVVDPRTIESIKKARKQGILFGLCTGRDADSVRNHLKRWGIEGLVDLVVGSGGSEIDDYVLNIYQENHTLKPELIKEVMEHFKDMDCNFTIGYKGKLFAPKDDTYIRMLAEGDGIEYEVVDFDEFLVRPYRKLMIICDPEYMPKIVERAKTFKNEKYKASALITSKFLYEYMDPRVSKSGGLEEALKLHHIPLSDCLAFGDADNDYDMLKEVGMGVAMENGSTLTKSVADYITLDCDSNGIGTFIDKHVLK